MEPEPETDLSNVAAWALSVCISGSGTRIIGIGGAVRTKPLLRANELVELKDDVCVSVTSWNSITIKL